MELEYGDDSEKHKDLVPDDTNNMDNPAKSAEPLMTWPSIILILRLV